MEHAMKNLLMAALLCQAAAGALAQASLHDPVPTAGGAAQAGASAFRCGGVGVDEQERFKAEAARHDALLTFATSNGAYVADVDVEVRQGGKTVLQGHCSGPLMLLDLPSRGTYEIHARAAGREQQRTLTLGDKPASLTFTWPPS
jgi:hypothetical protein